MAPHHRHQPAARTGYSLIEVLIVLGVIALLLALLVPAIQRVRAAAARTGSTSNLQQLALGCHHFHDQSRYLPYNGVSGSAKAGQQDTQSWAFQILPYVEQVNLFELGDGTGPPASVLAPVAVFRCPGRARPGFVMTGPSAVQGPTTDYGLNPYLNDPNGDVNAGNSRATLDGIADGTSTTILLGQPYLRSQDWSTAALDASGNPAELASFWSAGTKATARDAGHFYSDNVNKDYLGNGQWGGPFSEGGLFAMADGSVHLLPYSLATEDGTVQLALLYFFTPRDGQTVELPD